jgi:hypothetical protein
VNLEIANGFFQLTAWDLIDQWNQNSADFENDALKEELTDLSSSPRQRIQVHAKAKQRLVGRPCANANRDGMSDPCAIVHGTQG